MNTDFSTTGGQAWHALSVSDVLTQLKVPGDGLTTKDVADRLITYGPNKLPNRLRFTASHRWQRKFTTATVILMIIALLFKTVIGEISEAIALSVIVILNIIIYILIEHHAQQGLRKTQKPVISEIETIRNGQRQSVSVNELNETN